MPLSFPGRMLTRSGRSIAGAFFRNAQMNVWRPGDRGRYLGTTHPLYQKERGAANLDTTGLRKRYCSDRGGDFNPHSKISQHIGGLVNKDNAERELIRIYKECGRDFGKFKQCFDLIQDKLAESPGSTWSVTVNIDDHIMTMKKKGGKNFWIY
tara:strand:- start:1202 stop:1660 length:459 start_codon:yes stop_codon:yes gene_type:complete